MRIALPSLVPLAALVLWLPAPSPAAADAGARGDAAWSRRAEGEREGRPRPEPTLEALAAYEAALAERPGDLEAHWKRLRALHFLGDFVEADPDAKREAFDRGRVASEEARAVLAAQLGTGVDLDEAPVDEIAARLTVSDAMRRDAARLYFWAAVNWGAWSRTVGLLSAVRRGVANRLYDYTRLSIELEPEYEDGGALRLLGRLHAQLPRVPLLSGWVDRDLAIPTLERACAIAPRVPGNRYLLALTILELEPGRRAEAVDLLRRVADDPPRPAMRIEDLAVQKLARERLASLSGSPGAGAGTELPSAFGEGLQRPCSASAPKAEGNSVPAQTWLRSMSSLGWGSR